MAGDVKKDAVGAIRALEAIGRLVPMRGTNLTAMHNAMSTMYRMISRIEELEAEVAMLTSQRDRAEGAVRLAVDEMRQHLSAQQP